MTSGGPRGSEEGGLRVHEHTGQFQFDRILDDADSGEAIQAQDDGLGTNEELIDFLFSDSSGSSPVARVRKAIGSIDSIDLAPAGTSEEDGRIELVIIEPLVIEGTAPQGGARGEADLDAGPVEDMEEGNLGGGRVYKEEPEVDARDVLEDIQDGEGRDEDEEDESVTEPMYRLSPQVTDWIEEQARIEKQAKAEELAELDEKIRAKEKAIADAAAKGVFSRGLRRLSGAKAADERELDQLLIERAKKWAEVEGIQAPEQPVETTERSPETGVLGWFSRNKRIAAIAIGVAALVGISNRSINQSENLSENSTLSALSKPAAPAAVEIARTAETPTSAPAEVAVETQPTLWAQILKQANGDEAKAAQIKMNFLKNNGAQIADSADQNWLNEVEDDVALWNATIKPNLVKWGFAHPSLKMKTSIQSAQNLRELLNADRNNANWILAEVVLMLKPDFSSKAITTFSTQTAKAESADATLPNTLPEMATENAGDDIDLAPYLEPSPWHFETPDDIALPSPEPVDPTDVPEPWAFLRENKQSGRA